MSLFSKKPAPPPVDNNRIRNLLKLGMRETEAADRNVDSPAFQQAKAAFDAELGKATQAEKAKAFEALKRHGY
jgi:hypothetical protein